MVEDRLKIALVSGAAHALKYKMQNPNATDEDAIQHITRESDNIISKLDSEE